MDNITSNLPSIQSWSLFEYEGKEVIIGYVHNHYKLANGICIRTSRVQKIEGSLVTTMNSLYVLGIEDSSIDNRQILINHHPLFCVKRGISA